MISLLVWTDEVSESGQPPKSDSQFFDDEAHFESDDSDEAPLIQTWQKIKPVAVRARGTSPFEVTAAGRRNVKVDLSMNSDSDAGRRFSRFAFPRTRLLQLPTCFDDILPRITEDSAAPSYCACEVAEDVLEETQNIVAEPPIDNSVISCFPETTLWYDVQVS